MSILSQYPELRQMSDDQKLVLVEELLSDIGGPAEDLPVSAALWSEIDRRMAEYERDPSQVVPWREARERFRQKYGARAG